MFAWQPPAGAGRRAQRRAGAGRDDVIDDSTSAARCGRAGAAARVQRDRRAGRRPTSTSRAARRARRGSADEPSCWRPRWPCARRGSATSTSTSRRSARRRRSTPRSRSTSRALPWPEPADWVARVRGESRWSRSARRRREPRPLRLVGTASTSTATGARSARSPPTCARCGRAAVDDAARWPTALAPAVRAAEDAISARGARADRRAAAASRSSPAGRAPARRRPSRGSSRCWPSRRASGRWSRWPRRPARPRRGSRRPSTTRRRQLDVAPRVRERLLALNASTLHRLLGWRPGSHSRFRHHRGNRLPHDVVIVDETSMVSLSLMARLVEAVRPDARLVLVGDPGQLTSIEAGAVLGDIVGAGGPGVVGARPRAPLPARDRRRSRRRSGAGDADAAIAALRGGPRTSRGSRSTWAIPRRSPASDGRSASGRRVGERGDRPRRARGPSARGARRARRASGCCARTAAGRTASRRGRRGSRRWLAGEVGRGPLVPRPAAARHRERLRAAALQRRHRRGRGHRGGQGRRRRSSAAASRCSSRPRGWARSRPSTR